MSFDFLCLPINSTTDIAVSPVAGALLFNKIKMKRKSKSI